MLLDKGEAIPCDLMAKILKFQLLQIKANDKQRREAEQVSVSSYIYMILCVNDLVTVLTWSQFPLRFHL